jgi:DNA-directed RNA polymerase specialized sigma subunit
MTYHEQIRMYQKRKKKIIAMRESGSTLEDIAVKMGVSRQRIFQLCKDLTNPVKGV